MNKPIFIHIPKTGGQSIQQTLGNNIVTIGHHRTASQVKNMIDYWNNTFKFSSIRNPWDRMVSTYHFKLKKRDKKVVDKTFEEWVLKILPTIKVKDQYDYLTEDGKLIVDYVIKFENIKKDFQTLCQRTKLHGELLHKNKTKHEDYHKHYTKETKEMIQKIFAKEIEFFEYSF